jgi:hypothetical protein
MFIDSLRDLLWLWRAPSTRLQDRIRELSAQAVASGEPDFQSISDSFCRTNVERRGWHNLSETTRRLLDALNTSLQHSRDYLCHLGSS